MVTMYARCQFPASPCKISTTLIPPWLARSSNNGGFVKKRASLTACFSVTLKSSGIDMVVVLIALDAVMIISRKRGIPRVTLAPAPAARESKVRWKMTYCKNATLGQGTYQGERWSVSSASMVLRQTELLCFPPLLRGRIKPLNTWLR